MTPLRTIALSTLAAVTLAACADKPDPPPEPPLYLRHLREGPVRWEIPRTVVRPVVRPRINREGIAIIEETEGLRLEAYALAGQWLIGYGHAGTAHQGMVIDEEEAERLLFEDLARTEKELKALLDVELNDNEWAAVVSLAYNLGVGGFSRTLAYERLAAGDRQGAADAFLYLDSAVMDGVRQESPHLKARRARERELFLTPVLEGKTGGAP